MNIDPRKLYEQDEEFKDFVLNCFAEMLKGKSGNDLITALYSFYSIGMTSERVGQWMKMNRAMNEKSEDE